MVLKNCFNSGYCNVSITIVQSVELKYFILYTECLVYMYFPQTFKINLFNMQVSDCVACTCSKYCIQLFRERLSERVHATIPKGIVGGFEFLVLQRKLKELARKAMKMCLRVLTESNKSRFDSYSRQEQCIDHIPYYLSGLSHAHFFRQPFSK